MKEPTTTCHDIDVERRRVRFSLEGGDLAEGWAPRPGNPARCDVVAYLDEGLESGGLGSFGGEVWPAAWPSLFTVGPRTKDGQATYLTERGVEIVRAMLEGGIATSEGTKGAMVTRCSVCGRDIPKGEQYVIDGVKDDAIVRRCSTCEADHNYEGTERDVTLDQDLDTETGFFC